MRDTKLGTEARYDRDGGPVELTDREAGRLAAYIDAVRSEMDRYDLIGTELLTMLGAARLAAVEPGPLKAGGRFCDD